MSQHVTTVIITRTPCTQINIVLRQADLGVDGVLVGRTPIMERCRITWDHEPTTDDKQRAMDIIEQTLTKAGAVVISIEGESDGYEKIRS